MEPDRTAADVFGLLSDETRLDVLRAVAAAQAEAPEAGVPDLSFTDLYERVDVDDTAKLSYHLGELTGTLLRKHDGGYAFTYAGEQLVRFVLAENYRPPSEVDPVETEGRCLHCGATTLRADLHEQYFFVRCSDCERPAFSYRVRPAHLRAREGTDLVDAVVWEHAGDLRKVRQGVCPDCAGCIETTVVAADATAAADDLPVSYATRSECRQCSRFLSAPLPHALAYHPESVAFHWEHGRDVAGTAFWEFHDSLYEGEWTSERVAEGPPRYRVEYRTADRSLRLSLDERAAVTRAERVGRTDPNGRRT